jgi:tryptophan synthase alpha chain
LTQTLRQKQREKGLLLMTHTVLGYPDLDTSFALIESMVQAGVDLVELQIPFSEPIADGPVILRANQEALKNGIDVERCLEFTERVCSRFDIPFLFMTYYNILYRRGVDAFAQRAAEVGVQGLIVPDLPPEESAEYERALSSRQLDRVFIFAPSSSEQRMRQVAQHGSGFVYCVARKGVTGSATDFDAELATYLARARAATQLPLAVGFGVKTRADVDFLRGKADIAVVGSQTLRVLEEQGLSRVRPFLEGLRPGS